MSNDGNTANLYAAAFPKRWERKPLYPLAEWINGLAFRSVTFSGTGRPVVKIAEVKNGISGQTKFTKAEYDPKYKISTGDLLYSWSGQPETSIDIFWWRGPEGWLNQHVFKVLVDDNEVDETFFFYLMKYLKPSLVAIASNKQTTGLGHVTKADLQRVMVALPERHEQRAIAAVLGALDDKIEQNRRTGRALEGLARATFKAWFVDFEPVKAKAAGQTRFPGLPPATFAALPDRLTDSPLGPVPDGWAVPMRVAELERKGWLLIGDGYRAKRMELADVGLPFIRAGNVNGTIQTSGAELLGAAAVAKAGVKRSQVWDTVFTSKGTVGRIGLVTPAVGEVVYAPQVCFWRSANADSLSPFLLHLWMKSDCFTNQWMSVKGQTDMADFVSLSDQRAMTMLVPPGEIQRAFDAVARPLIELQAALDAESCKLAALRDYLLPRLLSGRVWVREAERAVDEVV